MTSTSCPSCGAAPDPETGTCATCDRITAQSGKKVSHEATAAKAAPSSVDAQVPKRAHDDLTGSMLGAYRLLELIGVGGIGHVYRAEHVRLSRQVAIKRLRPEYAAHSGVVARFFAEAKAANQIAHENIVEITDFVENDPAGTFLVMELLKGNDLGHVLDSCPILPLDRSVRILVQVARALSAAHHAGIVHRDLKPDNVFLTERAGVQDFVKLLDFGVAKLTQDELSDPTASHRTAAGSVLGTPAYMAPEQACGQPTDHRIDVYAMGVIMYELVTGRLPFNGSSLGEFIIQHATAKPLMPSRVDGAAHGIPPAFESLIMHCLAKAAGDRPDSMEDVESALYAIAAAQGWPLEAYGVAPAPRPAPLPLMRAPTRTSRVASLGALAMFVLGAAALGWVGMHGGGRDASSHPRAAGAATPIGVSLRFESQPVGAEVWSMGADTPLGITPFVVEVPRASATHPSSFEFRKSGFAPARLSIVPSEDRLLLVSLSDLSVAAEIRSATEDSAPTSPDDSNTEGSSTRSSRRSRSRGTSRSAMSSEIERNAVLDPFRRR